MSTGKFNIKTAGSTDPKDNWDRFDGDSTEPEWDIETDSDECVEPESMDDRYDM